MEDWTRRGDCGGERRAGALSGRVIQARSGFVRAEFFSFFAIHFDANFILQFVDLRNPVAAAVRALGRNARGGTITTWAAAGHRRFCREWRDRGRRWRREDSRGGDGTFRKRGARRRRLLWPLREHRAEGKTGFRCRATARRVARG